VDSSGKVYVAVDPGVRLLTPSFATCTYSILPTILEAAAAGDYLDVSFQTSSNSCSPAFLDLPSWISVSETVGTDPANVLLQIEENNGTTRSAAILVGGVTVTVSQLGTCENRRRIAPCRR
jgi:hypothetical protein